jgi:DNA-binding response OmpR family regulator
MDAEGTQDAPRVLLVEDDRKLAVLTQEFLERHGMRVESVGDGPEALGALGGSSFDVILLDLTLPTMDGLALARQVRGLSNTPLIIVTARGAVEDRVRGLELGADDYLAKPFHTSELLARIRAVLRRAGRALPSRGLEVDLHARTVRLEGQRVRLTTHEFELLAALVCAPGQVLSRDALLERMKGARADEAFDRSIDVHMSRLRQKLEADPRNPRFLKTVRGVGYVFTPEA